MGAARSTRLFAPRSLGAALPPIALALLVSMPGCAFQQAPGVSHAAPESKEAGRRELGTLERRIEEDLLALGLAPRDGTAEKADESAARPELAPPPPAAPAPAPPASHREPQSAAPVEAGGSAREQEAHRAVAEKEAAARSSPAPGGGGAAGPTEGEACPERCRLARAICRAAERICVIAAYLADGDAAARCRRARRDCEASRRATEQSCSRRCL